MADNVIIPATGSGAATPSVATDDVGGQHYQRVKISDGVADSSVHLAVVSEDLASAGGETGILAMVVRKDTPANLSGTDGDFEYLQVSGGKLWVQPLVFPVTVATDVTRPADTAVYAINDCMSDSTSAPVSGGFTFTNAARKSGGSGIIHGCQVATAADAATLLVGELWLFNAAVTNVNDNAAFVVSDAEIKTCIGKIPFALEDAGNNGFYSVSGLDMMFTCVGTANLRFLVRVKNAYTPVSAEVLTFTLRIEQLD